MKKKITAGLAALALCVGGLTVAPVIGSNPVASADAFTCVNFGNYNGGYSQADGCRRSRYKEYVKGTWLRAAWKDRGHRSQFGVCHPGWKASDYDKVD